jgi:hypothetical protein
VCPPVGCLKLGAVITAMRNACIVALYMAVVIIVMMLACVVWAIAAQEYLQEPYTQLQLPVETAVFALIRASPV